MTVRPVVTPLRPRAAPPGYDDTAALNDIHALLTAGDPGDAALADVALILARTGRPMAAARDIEVTTFRTVLGWPAPMRATPPCSSARPRTARACSSRSAPRPARTAAA
jgi:hypothetical protein